MPDFKKHLRLLCQAAGTGATILSACCVPGTIGVTVKDLLA